MQFGKSCMSLTVRTASMQFCPWILESTDMQLVFDFFVFYLCFLKDSLNESGCFFHTR